MTDRLVEVGDILLRVVKNEAFGEVGIRYRVLLASEIQRNMARNGEDYQNLDVESLDSTKIHRGCSSRSFEFTEVPYDPNQQPYTDQDI